MSDGFAYHALSEPDIRMEDDIPRIQQRKASQRQRRTKQLLKSNLELESHPDVKRVSSHCLATQLTSGILLDARKSLGIQSHSYINEEVAYFEYSSGDTFVFLDLGVVVCWDFDDFENTESRLLSFLENGDRIIITDDYDYLVDDNVKEFSIFRNLLLIPQALVGDRSDLIYFKLSCSYALALSGKLELFEEEIETVIENTLYIPMELATTGAVTLSQKDISCIIGELFIHKHSVNLVYDILDVPDFFWDFPEFENAFLTLRKHVEVESRAKILNQRLEVMGSLMSILRTLKSTHRAEMVEWAIIWLLVVECVLGITEIALSELGLLKMAPMV